MCGHGTKGCGLVIGLFRLMILKVFSNLYDSVVELLKDEKKT